MKELYRIFRKQDPSLGTVYDDYIYVHGQFTHRDVIWLFGQSTFIEFIHTPLIQAPLSQTQMLIRWGKNKWLTVDHLRHKIISPHDPMLRNGHVSILIRWHPNHAPNLLPALYLAGMVNFKGT